MMHLQSLALEHLSKSLVTSRYDQVQRSTLNGQSMTILDGALLNHYCTWIHLY